MAFVVRHVGFVAVEVNGRPHIVWAMFLGRLPIASIGSTVAIRAGSDVSFCVGDSADHPGVIVAEDTQPTTAVVVQWSALENKLPPLFSNGVVLAQFRSAVLVGAVDSHFRVAVCYNPIYGRIHLTGDAIQNFEQRLKRPLRPGLIIHIDVHATTTEVDGASFEGSFVHSVLADEGNASGDLSAVAAADFGVAVVLGRCIIVGADGRSGVLLTANGVEASFRRTDWQEDGNGAGHRLHFGDPIKAWTSTRLLHGRDLTLFPEIFMTVCRCPLHLAGVEAVQNRTNSTVHPGALNVSNLPQHHIHVLIDHNDQGAASRLTGIRPPLGIRPPSIRLMVRPPAIRNADNWTLPTGSDGIQHLFSTVPAGLGVADGRAIASSAATDDDSIGSTLADNDLKMNHDHMAASLDRLMTIDEEDEETTGNGVGQTGNATGNSLSAHAEEDIGAVMHGGAVVGDRAPTDSSRQASGGTTGTTESVDEFGDLDSTETIGSMENYLEPDHDPEDVADLGAQDEQHGYGDDLDTTIGSMEDALDQLAIIDDHDQQPVLDGDGGGAGGAHRIPLRGVVQFLCRACLTAVVFAIYKHLRG